jgi:hypothetical protein
VPAMLGERIGDVASFCIAMDIDHYNAADATKRQ